MSKSKQSENLPSTTAAMMTAQTEQAITMAKDSFETVASKLNEAMEQNLRSVKTITEMSRGNVDALLESSRLAAGGLQVIAQEVTTYSKQTFERTTAAVRGMSQARTGPELMQLQSDFARAEFSTAIEEMTKLSQTIVETMTALFEPLQKQAIVAAQVKDVLREE